MFGIKTKSQREYEALTSQLYREADYIKRVIDSCATYAQLQSARQMAVVNAPERWNFLIERLGERNLLLPLWRYRNLLNRKFSLATELLNYWWDKVELNQEATL